MQRKTYLLYICYFWAKVAPRPKRVNNFLSHISEMINMCKTLIKNKLYSDDTSCMTCLESIQPNSDHTKSPFSIENSNSRATCTVSFIFFLSRDPVALLACWFYRTGCKIHKDIVSDWMDRTEVRDEAALFCTVDIYRQTWRGINYSEWLGERGRCFTDHCG